MSDADGILSLPGAWKWIKERKFTIKKQWSPILSSDYQLLGYVKEYNQNFTFATIHGSGHSGIIERWDIAPDLVVNFVLEKPFA